MNNQQDRLKDIFKRQASIQQKFFDVDIDKEISWWPPKNLDITSKKGQKFLREVGFRMIEELAEAFRHLKNKPHSQKDNREINREELNNEISDVFTYFVNICLFLGITDDMLYDEYIKKNDINNKRIELRY